MARFRPAVIGQLWRSASVVVAALVVGQIVQRGLSAYDNFVVGTIAVAAIAAIGLNILVGNAGLVSLATPAFMAIGAYGSGIVLQHSSLGIAGAALIPVALAIVIGGVVGLLALRLRGFYLGLATLGLLEATQYVLQQGGSLVGSGYGFAMPEVSVGGVVTAAEWSGVATTVLVVVIACTASVRRSPVGRGLALMRQHETVAGCTGMNVVGLKIGAFAVSAGLGALAGVLFGFVQGAVSPDQFSLTLAVSQLSYIVFGGLGTVAGAVIGTVVLLLIPELFRSLGQNQGILNAAVLLGVLVVAPQGMFPLARTYMERLLTRVGWHERRDRVRAARTTSRRAEVAAAPSAVFEAPTAVLAPGEEGDPSASSGSVRFRDVTVRYGGVVAVNGFSATVRRGAVHGLIGPNGAGKSSAVGALFGLVRLTSGQIEVNGRTVQSSGRRSTPWQVAGAGVGRTFQTPVGGNGLTALEAVENGMFRELPQGFVRTGLRTGRVLAGEWEAAERARQALDLVRFTSSGRKPVEELTLGELRRVELARVLVGDPEVIVLDEPTSGMELADADALFELLGELARSGGRSVLVVEHNVRLIFGHSDDVTVMNLGEVIASGRPEDIRADELVKEAYLGAR